MAIFASFARSSARNSTRRKTTVTVASCVTRPGGTGTVLRPMTPAKMKVVRVQDGRRWSALGTSTHISYGLLGGSAVGRPSYHKARTSGPRRCLVVITGILAASSCADPGPAESLRDPSVIAVTDSGEVQLVEVPGEVLDSLPKWTLSDEPLLMIGETVGEDPYMFGGIEDALRLPSGETIIVEEFDFEFRVFGPDGVFRRAFGGRGEGPGEFKSVSLRRLRDGGFAVADAEQRRITFYDDQSNLQWTRPGACRPGDARSFHDPPLCYFAGLTGEGAIFWYGARRERSARIREDVVVREPGAMYIVALATGDSATVIDSIPSSRRATVVGGGGSGARWMWSVRELFAPAGSWAFGPGMLALGQSGQFEVRVYDSAGTLRRILRVNRQPETVTREHLDSVRAWVVDPTMARSPRDLALQYLDEVAVGGPIPFFGELRFDGVGRLWISDYVPPPSLVTRQVWRWTIFGNDGLPLARAVTGPSGDILEIGEDYILVRERDELDVEYLAVYGISRGTSAG